jgi:YidC/Oxa1 family membrane protein insertase
VSAHQPEPAIPTSRLVIFMIAMMVFIFVYNWIDVTYFRPKQLTPPQQQAVRRELAPLVELVPTGAGLGDMLNFVVAETWRSLPKEARDQAVAETIERGRRSEKEPKALVSQAGRAAQQSALRMAQPRPELIELGGEGYNLRVRLTTRGGGVDRVIVPRFPQADWYGRGVKNPDGSPQPLHLIPSPEDLPPVERDNVPSEQAEPSFVIYHYAKPDEVRPEPTLGEMTWRIVERQIDPAAETQQVVMQADLPDLGIRLTKTFRLHRRDYHVGLNVKIERLAGSGAPPFRYQLSGAHRLAIEGVWYTPVFRNFVAGFKDARGRIDRVLVDAGSIHLQLGSEAVLRGPGEIQYAAVVSQFFASAICLDETQEKRTFIERARATAQGSYPKGKPMLGDIQPRVVSEVLTLGDAPVEHRYLLYHGPVKVRQLYQFRDGSVDHELVERYEKSLNLRTLTDWHTDTWLGRFAHFIGWSDLTIAFTNLMHGVLGFLMRTLHVPFLAVIGLTVLVRLLLLPLSRRQAASMQRMQEKMAVLQPKLKELEERLKREGRSEEIHQAKMKLMLDHGINPMAQLGGCLMIFLQMPIFMGLYYALQENVFFRLEPFLWAESLTAPDMLLWWSEKIPFISTPDSLGAFYYLGPYLNILPILAVGLMLVQQKWMTPPPADEQQAQQQAMMKYMLILFGLFFYKTASGLVLYFIISTLWGLAERKFLPRKPLSASEPKGSKGAGTKVESEPRSETWLQRKLREIQEAAAKRDNTFRREESGPSRKKRRK